MKIFARGEAQSLEKPGTFLDREQFGRVVGVTDLGGNNGQNDYGWCGVKAVVHIAGENYILDHPSDVRIETDDGLEFLSCSFGDRNCWVPSLNDRQEFDLYLFDCRT